MMYKRLSWLLVTIGLAACDSTSKGPVISPAVDIYHTTDDGRMVRYGVSQFGTLRFAGGYPARDGQWSWTGHITPAQGAELASIVKTGQWFGSPPTGDGADQSDTWEITVREGDSYRRFQVHGSPPSVLRAWAVLDGAGQARLQADLDRLPSADIGRLLQRRSAEAEVSTE
jgi:hypothetical protein